MKRILSVFLILALIVSLFSQRYLSTEGVVSACDDEWEDASVCIASSCGTTEGTKTQAKYTQVFEYSCPIIHFEWETYECPVGYPNESHSHDGYCYKGSHPDWPEDYKNILTIYHSADIKYEKSSDPNKCHRPSDDTLRDVYGMSRDVRNDFKHDNSEWKNIVSSNCHQEVADTRTVECKDAQVIECQTSPTPSPVPICEWSDWEECSVACGGGTQVSYLRGEGCSNEARWQSCNPETCTEPSPTPTPFSPEFPNCPKDYQGNIVHYDRNAGHMHQIVGGSLLAGGDDVYYLDNGNFLQCFCPDEGDSGIQTNWWRTDEILGGW